MMMFNECIILYLFLSEFHVGVQPCGIYFCGMCEVNGGFLMLIVYESLGSIWLEKMLSIINKHS